MEDPGKMMEREMQETTELQRLRAENKRLRSLLRDAQRLMSQAVSERDKVKRMLDDYRERYSIMFNMLVSLTTRWPFRFYPRWLRDEVHRL